MSTICVNNDNPVRRYNTAKSVHWMRHIEDVYLGKWKDLETGKFSPRSPVKKILIADSLDGIEADLVSEIGLGDNLAVVADVNTWDSLGQRVVKSLTGNGYCVHEIILDGKTHATLATAESLAMQIRFADAAIAVGSGTINDLVKYVTSRDGRDYCVFGTAPSMDGYASQTASMGLESGLKVSLPAHAPKGVFLDINVLAAAPGYTAAAGFGDCLCTSVARIDWWMSHRLLGTDFWYEPYRIADADGELLGACAKGIGKGEHAAIGQLTRSLVLSGLGVNFTGVSNHGSMGEHQISHYIDCFAGTLHPGTLHGQQVGLASLTMARIQNWFLEQSRPPAIYPSCYSFDNMVTRMGLQAAKECAQEYRKKTLDEEGAAKLNEKLQHIWPELRKECQQIMQPVTVMKQQLADAGGGTTAEELNIPIGFYRQAVRHAHEMRNRFSFADLACDAGLLDDFVNAEL